MREQLERLGGLEPRRGVGARRTARCRRCPASRRAGLADPGAVHSGRRRAGRAAQAPLARGGAGGPRAASPHPAVQDAAGAGARLARPGRARGAWRGAAGEVTVLRPPRSAVAPMLVSGPGQGPRAGRRAGLERCRPRRSGRCTRPPPTPSPRTVVELLQPRPGDRAWDLYGGAGLFAAALAPHLDGTGRITVVEGDPKAAGAAQRLPAGSDHRHRASRPMWSVRSATRAGARRPGRARPAAGRRRPGRGGADRGPLAPGGGLRGLRPGRARPRLATFRQHGCELAALRAFDLFPQTHHVECVALLTAMA